MTIGTIVTPGFDTVTMAVIERHPVQRRGSPGKYRAMLSEEEPCCHTSMLIMTLITDKRFPTESR